MEPALPDIEEQVPFERRVIQRLAHGVQAVCEAVERGSIDTLMTDVPLGFSANAFEELTKLVECTNGGLTFEFSFSPEWRVPKEFGGMHELVVNTRHAEYTRAVAKALRRQAISRPETVIGRVERLISQDDPSDLLNPRGEREVNVRWLSEDLGEILVRVSLQPADYLTAIEAHKAGQPIKISGTLEVKGRSWNLSNPKGFSIA